MSYIAYVLRSIRFNRKYIGHTDDLGRRLREHNAGTVRSTKHYIPYEVIYTEILQTEREAVKREKYFKTHKGYTELKKILGA